MKLFLQFGIWTALLAAAGISYAKDTPQNQPGKVVDSGSFGVFRDGKRIATETFSITQNSSGSVVTSEFKMEKTAGEAAQSSKLEMLPSGDIVRYEWKEISPGSAEAYVAPNNDFLTEHYRDSSQAKEQQKGFLLPTSTSILDDYFFIQREILVWRYLATTCKTQKGVLQCPLKQEIKFGAMNPHSQLSISVSLTFLGPDDVDIHGTQRKLSKIELKSEGGDWTLWVDEQFKLVDINDASTGTEIVRD